MKMFTLLSPPPLSSRKQFYLVFWCFFFYLRIVVLLKSLSQGHLMSVLRLTWVRIIIHIQLVVHL
jgi:hypothetical protein